MTQNQASLRWKKPGFEQKFLMQGEKQVPETSGCRRFYGGPNINFHLYAYAGNSPVRYTDPDGKFIVNTKRDYTREFMQDYNLTWPDSNESIASTGCSLIASNRIANVSINEYGYKFDTTTPSLVTNMLNDSSLTCPDGMIFYGLANYLRTYGVNTEISDTGTIGKDINCILEQINDSESKYFVIGRLKEGAGHYVNINAFDFDSKTVKAYDTSANKSGFPKRDLDNISANNFDRLIIIKLNNTEEN